MLARRRPRHALLPSGSSSLAAGPHSPGRKGLVAGGLLALLTLTAPLHAEPLLETEIDTLALRTMAHQRIPGLAIGIWHDGRTLLNKGYGITHVDRPRPVDGETLFKTASLTKAFTAAALAILVDEGKLRWDSRVVDHLPDFALADPWITQEFRVEDLLTHRAGFGRGAGDLMLWPQPNRFTRDDIVRGLRHLPLPGRFRAEYAYDNLLYIVAGELVATVAGTSWEDFVQRRLLQPLGATHCHAGPVPAPARNNLAVPHLRVGDAAVVDVPNLPATEPIVSAAAGGMHCSTTDMLRWLRTLLRGGVTPDGTRLLSEEQRDRLWQPVTLMPLSPDRARRDHSHFYAYALGWRVQDMHGYRVLHHTGSLSGMFAWTALVPELDLALVLLMNRSSGPARSALSNALLKPFLDAPQEDWLARYLQAPRDLAADAREHPAPDGGPDLPAAQLAGEYRDPWFGGASIWVEAGALRWRAHKSPRLLGTLRAEAPGRWRLLFDDATLYAEAWLVTERLDSGAVGFRLLPVSPDIDSSYDFQDLYFRPVQASDQDKLTP